MPEFYILSLFNNHVTILGLNSSIIEPAMYVWFH